MGIVYEANRWHSPMCALDEVCSPFTFQRYIYVAQQVVEFAVIQNENGVPEEDCVEYYLKDDEELDILVNHGRSKLQHQIAGDQA